MAEIEMPEKADAAIVACLHDVVARGAEIYGVFRKPDSGVWSRRGSLALVDARREMFETLEDMNAFARRLAASYNVCAHADIRDLEAAAQADEVFCTIVVGEGASAPVIGVLGEIADERARQNAKWGEQNHLLTYPRLQNPKEGYGGNGPNADALANYYALPTAAKARSRCDERHKRGVGAWMDILTEEIAEVVEACAGGDEDAARAELVQLAAVAVAAIEAIDRRKAKGSDHA